MAIESPRYKVILQDGKFEIREYAEYILAEVEIEADYDEAVNRGFTILADYIFGNNVKRAQVAASVPFIAQKAGEKIAMTAPVTSSAIADGKKYRIAFTMPAKYSLESLPLPGNAAIKLRKVEQHSVAALRFSGSLTRKLAEIEAFNLDQQMKIKSLTPKSGFIFAQYNPPWIPGPFRHDEVMVDI